MADSPQMKRFLEVGLGICPQCNGRITIVQPHSKKFYCESKHECPDVTVETFKKIDEELPSDLTLEISRQCSGCHKIIKYAQSETWVRCKHCLAEDDCVLCKDCHIKCDHSIPKWFLPLAHRRNGI